MKYRAPKFINKENFRSILEETMKENFKGKIIVVHAYNFKYDVNGNRINHYKATMLDGTLSGEKAIINAIAGRGKTVIRCEKDAIKAVNMGMKMQCTILIKWGMM
ncbi:hypothetical protein HNDCFFNB_00149 [Citrobacter phage BSwM KMM2]|nr:hypothetical protein HNDCFFNB_00149 [Citrobacter phage BSwM KMM2]